MQMSINKTGKNDFSGKVDFFFSAVFSYSGKNSVFNGNISAAYFFAEWACYDLSFSFLFTSIKDM